MNYSILRIKIREPMDYLDKRLVLYSAVAAIVLIGLSGCEKREIADGTVVSILYTSDVRGRIEGCGCKHNGGGITKRSAKVATARAEDPTVVYCDAGNFFSGSAETDSTKGKLSIEVYNHMQTNVVNVSERELKFGVDAFRDARRDSKFKYVSANLRDGSSAITDAYVVLPVKEARVAFIGLCGTRQTMRYDSSHLPSSIVIENPIVAARTAVTALEGKADLIVILSTCGDETDSALAQALPQVNLIIGGRSFRPNAEAPWVIGETRVVRANRDGRTMGRMDMVFGPDRKIKMYNPTSVTMETQDPSDQSMLEIVRKHIPSFVDNPTDGVRVASSSDEKSTPATR